MSPSSDPTSSHPDAQHERALAELASHALGETVAPETVRHIDGCPVCTAEVAAYRATAALARTGTRNASAAGGSLPGPGPQVWQRIVDELHLDAQQSATRQPATRQHEPRVTRLGEARRAKRARRTRAGLWLAAAAVVLAVGIGGWAVGRQSGTGPSTGTAHAALAAQPGTSASAAGAASMHSSGDGYQLVVNTKGLPPPSGYYEVWLYDPSINHMVAVGTLGVGARGTFTVPAGIDTHDYHIVDVSNQLYNGNASHQRSVLRGPLVQS